MAARSIARRQRLLTQENEGRQLRIARRPKLQSPQWRAAPKHASNQRTHREVEKSSQHVPTKLFKSSRKLSQSSPADLSLGRQENHSTGDFSNLDENSSDQQIIAYCANFPSESLLSKPEYSIKVVRLSDRVAVKFGFGVFKEEAGNQKAVYSLFDSSMVVIPKVYRYFESDRCHGYLVMEYKEGHTKEVLEESDIKRVSEIVRYLSTFRAAVPGNLTGGPLRSFLCPEGVSFESIQELETWLNQRHRRKQKISFQGCELVLCHLDLGPRNFLWMEDGAICLLDWASAGFVPRLFEFVAQWRREGFDGTFTAALLSHMEKLPEKELAHKDALLEVSYDCQKYSFRRPKVRDPVLLWSNVEFLLE